MIHVENESIQALFKQLESDYQICVEKDLDTKEELQKQKDFTNNFMALQEFLEKIDAPESIKDQINEILEMLKSWDVYAFWFKEMKDLAAKCKEFFTKFMEFAEDNGIMPKPKKESAKIKAPQKPTPPGLLASQKPTPSGTPSLLKPIQRDAAPVQSISTFKTPTKPGSKKPEPNSAVETQGRKVPVLKPVFKHPPVKVPSTAQSASAGKATQKSIEKEPIDEDSAPVPLKALVENKKLEIKVKPVKLIKPIMAVKHEESPITDEGIVPDFEAEPAQETHTKAAKPALPVPVVEKKPTTPKGAMKTKLPPKATKTEKPLLIPKPIKIVVPDLGNIDLAEEITPAKPDVEDLGSPEEKEELKAVPGAEEIPVNDRAVKLPPRRVKPIAVNVKIDHKPSIIADENEEIVKEVTEKVTKRMTPEPKQIVVKFQSPEGEYITPAAIKPEDIEELGFDEVVSSNKGASGKNANNLVTKIESTADWDDETISKILDATEKEMAAASQPVSLQENESSVNQQKSKTNAADTITSAFKTFAPPEVEKKGVDKKGAEKKGADKKAADKKSADKKGVEKKAVSKENLAINVMDQEPQKKRLQEIKKPASATPAKSSSGGDNPMSLFTGALQSKINASGKKTGTSSSSIPMFTRNAAETDAALSKSKTSQAPIGSEVDIESLPETKDGLYQALIALEGKRYAIERAKKDLRADMDKGVIKPSDYEDKVTNLKVEMDKIGERIKEIREKIKKFK